MSNSDEQDNYTPESEANFLRELRKLSDAGAGVIQVRTREPYRCALTMRKYFLAGDATTYSEWDAINGTRNFTIENYSHDLKAARSKEVDFFTDLNKPMEELRKSNNKYEASASVVHFHAFINPHPYIKNNAIVAELLQQYANILPSVNVVLVLVTPEITIDDVPNGTLMVVDMSTPAVDELRISLEKLVENSLRDYTDGSELEDEDFQHLAQLGLGMTHFEFETSAAVALVDAGRNGARMITYADLADGIGRGKTEVVKQSEILELYSTVDMGEVGGMQRLKDWIEARKICFTDEARDFGIESPKGVVCVGVPGTGKSLVAKAIASTLELPLIRFSLERVFSKYVGDSESRVRAALKMVEAMAPCVLFIDEIDKSLGGAAGSSGDGGVSSRVLGSFLTWLNDYKGPVFTMVTANKVNGLPPELLRKGRFDQIFSVGLPTVEERYEVLQIHLRKRGHEIGELSPKDRMRFDEYSTGYVPAEIEAAVKDALIMALSEGKDTVTIDHLCRALKGMVPMSVSNASQIGDMVAWAANNAIPVNYTEESPNPQAQTGSTSAPRRRITRTTSKD